MLKIFRISTFLLLISFVLSLSVGGAYAAWAFYDTPLPLNSSSDLLLEEFLYKPEQILPDDDEIGESQLWTINVVLENLTFGMNSNGNKNDVFHANLAINHYDDFSTYPLFYVNQSNVTKWTSKHFFAAYTDIPESSRVYFCIQKISSTEYNVYTYVYSHLVVNQTAEVYKTVLQKQSDGNWEALYSQRGLATVIYFESSSLGPNPESWVRNTTHIT